jgi:hypothetical protein
MGVVPIPLRDRLFLPLVERLGGGDWSGRAPAMTESFYSYSWF